MISVEWNGGRRSATPATPAAEPAPAPVLNRMGACPGCGAEFTLGAAEKKKRSRLSAM
jgi:hypothetical protein